MSSPLPEAPKVYATIVTITVGRQDVSILFCDENVQYTMNPAPRLDKPVVIPIGEAVKPVVEVRMPHQAFKDLVDKGGELLRKALGV